MSPVSFFSKKKVSLLLVVVLTRWSAQAADRGILEVDPLNGAATLRVPLGPGIGRPGLRFVPALVGTFAPLVTPSGGASQDPGPSLLGASGFELSPGSLQVWLGPEDGPASLPRARWTYPDGSGGGTRGGSATGVTTKALWAAFDQAPAPEACPDPWLLSGQGGEVLVALPPAAAEGALFPSRMLVVRGEQGFEYEREEANEAHPTDAHSARYRLAAIRAEAGEAVTFTYGPDGLDFEAAWGTAKVQVTSDLEARLNVTYVGPEAIPGYTITASGGRPGDPNAFLRVDRAEGAERIEFRCAEAPALNQPGMSTGPPVVRDIILPGRTLRLDWEALPEPWRTAGAGPETWCYGVRAVHDLTGDGLESPGESYLRPAQVGPGQTWVRQSRHFALATDPGAEASCRTHVRDRWQFRWEAPGDPERISPDGESDIPTLERDSKTGALVPVPGQLTRWLNWGPEGPPDLHGDPRSSGDGRMRLLGGMFTSNRLAQTLEENRKQIVEMQRQQAEAQAADAKRMEENRRRSSESTERQVREWARQAEVQREQQRVDHDRILISAELARREAQAAGEDAMWACDLQRKQEQAGADDRKAAELRRKAEEDKRKATEVKRKVDEERWKGAEVARKAAEAQGKVRMAAEGRRNAKEAAQRAAEARRKAAEAEEKIRTARQQAVDALKAAGE